MFQWLVNLFVGVFSISDLIDRVRDGLTGIYNKLTAIFGGWGAAFIYLFNAAWYFTDRAWNLWFACLDYAQWVTFIGFPRLLGDAFRATVQWVSQQLAILRNDIQRAISFAIGVVTDALNTLRRTVTGWVNDIRSTLSSLWNRFVVIERRVVALLTDPRALSDWLAGQVSQAIGRWVVRNANYLGRLVLSRATGMTVQAAHLIEGVISSLFL